MSEDKKIYKVLIIDDAFFIRNLIKRAIVTKPEDDKLGYKFDVIGEAINGKEGIIQYFKHKPDIITLDINMPDINGIEVAKQIISKDPNAKIIAISGNLEDSITQEILNAGALEYIQKPFQNAYLWDKLDKVVDLIEGRVKKEETIKEEVIELVQDQEEIIEIIPEVKEPKKPEKKNFEIPSPLDIFPKEETVKPIKSIEEEKVTELVVEVSNPVSKTQDDSSVVVADGEDEDDDLLFTPKKQSKPPVIKEDVILPSKAIDKVEPIENVEIEKTSPIILEPVKEEVKTKPQQQKRPGNRKFPTAKVEEPLVDTDKEDKEEDKYKFSSEMEFDIDKELPIRPTVIVGQQEEDLPITLPDEEVSEEATTLDNEKVTVQDVEETIEIEIHTQNVQDYTPIDEPATQNVNEQTNIIEIAEQNDNEDTIFIIDGNSGSDIEININPQSQPAEDTETLIIIEGTSEDRETTNVHNEVEPIREDVITKQEEVITIREEVAPVREEIVSPYREEATPVQRHSDVINEPTSLSKGTTPKTELNVDTHIYNTENDKVSSSNAEKENSSTKIAPPRSKVLKEIYSEKMLNDYKVEFEDDEVSNEPNKVEKKKDGLFSSLKKLFNKK